MSLFTPKALPTTGKQRPYALLSVVGVALLAGLIALWLVVLLRPSAESGSLDARAEAIGQTVRCPICAEPIPVNDQQNTKSVAMRAFIRRQLQQGYNGDQIRTQLAARYGPTILLAPPLSGFDLTAWLVPVVAFVVAAAAVGSAARRWIVPAPAPPLTAAIGPMDETARRYEELLDRELSRR